MSDRRDVERWLDGLRPPAPPQELRARSLAAARAAMHGDRASAGGDDVWERAWRSLPLRLAWLAVVLVLVALHVAITPGIRDLGREVDAGPDADVILVAEAGPAVSGGRIGVTALLRARQRLGIQRGDALTASSNATEELR